MDYESAAYMLCDFVTWTAPRFLVTQANHWKWAWKAEFGTLYPEGVFIMATYLAVAVVAFSTLMLGRLITHAMGLWHHNGA